MLQTHTISTVISFQMDQEEDNIALGHQEHLDLMYITGDQTLSFIINHGINFKCITAIQMKHLNGVVSLTLICL